jgi:hypothetical protein
VVDIAVIGARGDGKTQFIVHAIRTLRAYAPSLTGDEHKHNREIMQVVMNARAPRPDATPPGVVPHYVFRIRPDALLDQLGPGGRTALLARAAGLRGHGLLAGLNAAAVGGATFALGHGAIAAGAVAGGAAVVGGALAGLMSRRRFVRSGEIEVVFWDVAGEHVYAESAADYYSFLSALVRARRATLDRAYGFAPVLVCNPMAVGVHAEGSPYARLRQLLPLYASLDPARPRALIAINRWSVVEEVCAPDSDRDEVVALAAAARDDDAAARRPAAELPRVRRDVVRRLCRDADDGPDDGVDLTHLRYDAGVECELTTRPREPEAAADDPPIIDYVYAEGPGAFGGDARGGFLRWLGELAYDPARRRAAVRKARALPDEDETEPGTGSEEVWSRPGGFGAGGT